MPQNKAAPLTLALIASRCLAPLSYYYSILQIFGVLRYLNTPSIEFYLFYITNVLLTVLLCIHTVLRMLLAPCSLLKHTFMFFFGLKTTDSNSSFETFLERI